jgi:O-methyltransferase
MTRSLMSRVRTAFRPIGSVDGIGSGRVVGWALGKGNVSVEAWIDGKCVVRSKPDGHRQDVAVAYPGRRGAVRSGFSLDLPPDAIKHSGLSELRILARPSSPLLPTATLGTFRVAGAGLHQALLEAAPITVSSPLPRAVTDLVAARWPDDCSDLASESGQRRFVRRLKQLMGTPGVNALPALAHYARYLTVTLAHCRFVEKHFPTENRSANADAADFHCKPNSVRELFPIIHQLYVLQSWGVEGDFAEFGCFKGYSSSMLSFACQQLRIPMHIFDSFEGLPPSEGSGYEPGQYAGSLAEVRENVSRFGAVGSVQFHKGFFADTFRDWRPPKLMCMWMDVDLEVSARDLMVVADRLDPRATVFSHECQAGIFQGGDIVSRPSPDNPVAPLLARFDELGRPLTGRYVSGYTGAFWPREGGIPVLDTDVLFELVSAYDR